MGRFEGETKKLTVLREELNVKEFVQLVNCFPELRKSMPHESGNAITRTSEILIFFDDSKSLIHAQSSNEGEIENSTHEFPAEGGLKSENVAIECESFPSEFCISTDLLPFETYLIKSSKESEIIQVENCDDNPETLCNQDKISARDALHENSKLAKVVNCLKSHKMLITSLIIMSGLAAVTLRFTELRK